MDKTNLVYVRGGEAFENESGYSFKPNRLYRSIKVSDDEWVVNGYPFDDSTFKDCFQFAHERIIAQWSGMDLMKGDSPISKTAFKKLADVHEYVGRRQKYRIVLFRNCIDIMFGFYPMNGTKAEAMDECYEMYCSVVNGNMEPFDDGDIQFGNRGIPISYSDLGVW